MTAKIIIDKEIIVQKPLAFTRAESMCSNVTKKNPFVILEPTGGNLVPVIVLLTQSEIAYQLHYQPSDSEKTSPFVGHDINEID